MSRIIIYAIVSALLSLHAAYGDGLYSIVGPGTIRSKYKYNVVVSVHKADTPCQIKVGITGPSYNETKIVDIPPMSTQNVEFDVPKLEMGDYNLTAVGVSGLTFENSTKLNYDDNKPSTFIQTDKATYKPGDLVKYRVLFLDANTKPADIEKSLSILINDGAQNRIKQLKDIKLTNGVFTGEFQLSEQPVLGSWNIEVFLGDEKVETKSFEVDKYVLPKFDVKIETAEHVAIYYDVIKMTVRSKYTYGKSVKGKATISIKPIYNYYGADHKEAQKTIDVDGKGHVEFSIKKDLGITDEATFVPPLQILAVMEEELTGNKYNSTTTIQLHAERFLVEGIDTPYTYYPNKPVIFNIVVKHLDGSPVQDTKNPVKLIIEPPRNYFYRGLSSVTTQPSELKDEEKPLELEEFLNDHGMVKFEVNLPETNHTFFSIKCKYLESTTYLSSLSKYEPRIDVPELLKITLKTEKPKLGEDVSIEISSNEDIPYFIYAVIARGNVVKSDHVTLTEGKRSHVITITPSFEMIPKAAIFIYYVVNGDLRFEEKQIEFEKTFENSIDISSTVQAKPGEEVTLKIKTDPNSFVGLLGVDQSVLLLKSGNDLSKDAIFNSLNKYETNTPWQRGYGRYPGQTAGLVTMTNANYPYDYAGILERQEDEVLESEEFLDDVGSIDRVDSDSSSTHTDTTDSVLKLKVRRDFMETWIFYNENCGDGEEITITKKIPDTITSWVITGFSLNPKSGIALTENATKIQVFQPFFVSTNLPYSVKRGEVISIPVIIFNYMEKTLDAEVVMDNTDKEYEFTEATNEVDDKPIDEIKRTKRITVPSNTGKSLSFMIRPKKVGDITLKITAVTPLSGDAIHQTLKVEPEGVTQYENRAIFINLKDQAEQTGEIAVDIPAEAVTDSEYIEFSVVGDLLGPTIQNLDKLVRMPYGCGEQNMVNFVPNILVLKYLETINQNKPTITEKAKKFLEIGYQRELTYKHDDGSYSAFGKSDAAGSTWLTAYVVRSFRQAAKYTDIDPKVILEGLEFLASKQAPNGSFPEYGKLFDSAHQNELGLTSFVLLAFLENTEHVTKYQSNIDKGLEFVLNGIDNSDDQYALSIAATALNKANNPKAEKVLAKLNAVAKHENDRKWWSKEQEVKTGEPQWYWKPRSNDVEITSYILLALLETQPAEEVLSIIKWLISQRNSNGGFSSTQDTVVGLQALIKFAEKTGSGSGEISIDFTTKGGTEDKGSIKVNPENSFVLQTHVLPKSTRQVNFAAKGSGSSMAQVAYRYNLAEKNKKPSFQVTTKVKENTPPKQLIVEVCAEFVPIDESEADKKESNMAVMEVALPSGYTAEVDSFNKIEAVERVKRTETKNSESTVIVYFDSLSKGDVKCVPIEATKTHAVAKQKPAAVSIYDYYDTQRRATEYYDVKSSLCDICEGEDCGKDCNKKNE